MSYAKLMFGALGASLLVGTANGAIVFSEDFNAGASGDNVITAPYTWSDNVNGTQMKVSNLVPMSGGGGLYVRGLSTPNGTRSRVVHDIADHTSLENYVFTAKARAGDSTRSSAVGFSSLVPGFGGALFRYLSAADTGGIAGWYFLVEGGVSGSSQVPFNVLGNGSVQNLRIDVTPTSITAKVDSATLNFTYNAATDPLVIQAVQLLQDPGGSFPGGIDVDDILVVSSAVPEPASLTAITVAAGMLLRRRSSRM